MESPWNGEAAPLGGLLAVVEVIERIEDCDFGLLRGVSSPLLYLG